MKKKKAAANALKVPRNASIRQIYARARAAFSAADLQRYTEIEPTIPAEQLLAELQAIHQRATLGRKKR